MAKAVIHIKEHEEVFDFGLRLKKFRNEHNFTQKQVSLFLDVSESTVSKYENNTQTPPPDKLILLARLYHTSIDYLLGLGDRKPIFVDDLPLSKQKMILDIIENVRSEYCNNNNR